MLQLVLLGSPARAQYGINLSWDDCGASGSSMKTFACDTNAGASVLVASSAVAVGGCFIGATGILDLQTSGAALPDWWQFKNAGACRQSALSASAVFVPGPFSCFDLWQGQAVAGVWKYEVGERGPNRARIVVSVAEPFECLDLAPGVEALTFRLTINNENTVGVGSCAGCGDGACIVLNQISFTQINALPPRVDLVAMLSRNYVTWQGGIPNCPGATPVQNRTWGAVKTLYR